MPPKKVPFLHRYFIVFFDGVCGADLFWPLLKALKGPEPALISLISLSMVCVVVTAAAVGSSEAYRRRGLSEGDATRAPSPGLAEGDA